jgi:hypothetical protein
MKTYNGVIQAPKPKPWQVLIDGSQKIVENNCLSWIQTLPLKTIASKGSKGPK